MKEFYSLSENEVLKKLGTSKTGLSQEKAEELRLFALSVCAVGDRCVGRTGLAFETSAHERTAFEQDAVTGLQSEVGVLPACVLRGQTVGAQTAVRRVNVVDHSASFYFWMKSVFLYYTMSDGILQENRIFEICHRFLGNIRTSA